MKQLFWVASSKKDLCDFPPEVRQEAGFALHQAQMGEKALNAVPMVGFGGASVLEVVIDDDGNTYRAVYTVKLPKAVYVLHAFQKKSKSGIATPKPDMELIRSRLRLAQDDHRARFEKQKAKGHVK